LVDREAIGVHGGTYAEELIASIVRARVVQRFPNELELHQNRWDKTAKREADICLLHRGRLVVVIEIKSALTKEEWKKAAQIKEDYNKLDNPPNYWLLAIRADGLDSGLAQLSTETPAAVCFQGRGERYSSYQSTILKSGSPWNRG